MGFRRLAGLVLLIGLALASPALAASTLETPHLSIAMTADTLHPRPGAPLTIAFDFRPKPGWHIYWTNPGDVGLAPSVDWSLPKGFSAGPLQHPVPEALTIQGVEANLHQGRAILLDRISTPASLTPGAPVPIRASLNWLVCSAQECVTEEGELSLRLAAGDGAPAPVAAALFKAARAALPRPLPGAGRYGVDKGRLSLLLPLNVPAGSTDMHLFLDDQALGGGASQWFERLPDGLRVTAATPARSVAGRISGVLRLAEPSGQVVGYSFVAAPIAAAPAPAPAAPSIASGAPLGFLLAFSSALAGGLVLNLMPCVFPILSLKALALARAGGDEREARREALGYAAGAMGVLLALGGGLILARAEGDAVGWAFQLQDPRVVALLMVLCVGIALNLAGLFELPTITGGAGRAGGFVGGLSTGALAAFVATPCTGPFMAGALGAALVLPPLEALAVFAGLGAGLSLPFLAIGFAPALRARLPRPGAWMATLRRALSLPMFATALGLGWVLGRQSGVDAMAVGLGAALVLGAGLWWVGLRQASGRSAWLPAAAALATALLALQPIGSFGRAATPPAAPLLSEQPYSAAKLAELRRGHQPVFVYLTADWCLSCKVNEATSLSSPAVARAFSAAGVVVLKGDWTRGDPEVTRLLTGHGRAGVPLYLFYPRRGAPRTLPQVLTPSILVRLARSAA